MWRLKNSQTGETIVEVLIALSILGLSLGLAYSSAASSIRKSQDTQERAEAYQIAQSMIEAVRFLVNNDSYKTNPNFMPQGPAGTGGASRDFCLTLEPTEFGNLSQAILPYNESAAANSNPMSRPGQICNHGDLNLDDVGRYRSWINATRNTGSGNPHGPSSSSRYTYTANVAWDSLNGTESNVQLRYKWTVIND